MSLFPLYKSFVYVSASCLPSGTSPRRGDDVRAVTSSDRNAGSMSHCLGVWLTSKSECWLPSLFLRYFCICYYYIFIHSLVYSSFINILLVSSFPIRFPVVQTGKLVPYPPPLHGVRVGWETVYQTGSHMYKVNGFYFVIFFRFFLFNHVLFS